MKAPLVSSVLLFLASSAVSILHAENKEDGWVSLFNHKTLDGWKASEDPESFAVQNGIMVIQSKGKQVDGQGSHVKSHLFYIGGDGQASFTNFEFQCDVKTEPNSNGGIYFHTEFMENAWPQKGFEVQINNTYKDKKKTGSLYAVSDVLESPVKDSEWFHVFIKVDGKRVRIKVNDEIVVDWTEPEGFKQVNKPWFSDRRLSSGTFALQAHDEQSKVYIKNIMARPLQ